MISRLAFLLCICVPMYAVGQDEGAQWWVGTGERSGDPVVLRALNELPKPYVRASHPWAVKVIWVRSKTTNDQFSAEDSALAFEFQQALTLDMEKSGFAFEALSVTVGGTSEWTYYAAEKDTAFRVFESARRKFPGASPSMTVYHDSDWSALQEVLRVAGK